MSYFSACLSWLSFFCYSSNRCPVLCSRMKSASRPVFPSPCSSRTGCSHLRNAFLSISNPAQLDDTAVDRPFFYFAAAARRDKKWHFIFTVLSTWHLFLLAFGAFAAHRQRVEDGGRGLEIDWQNVSRLAMLGAHALRPIMLISNLQTTRRVFTNVLRRVC